MELTWETFNKGIHTLTLAYQGWDLESDAAECWYTIIKTCIPEEDFLETIYFYCQQGPAPTCCADLINYGLAVVVSEKSWDISNNTPNQQPVEPGVISQTEYNFNRIWDAYPISHRGDRKEALKAYKQISGADNSIDDILIGLLKMKGKQSWQKDEGRLVPGLARFLEDHIWEEWPFAT